jgi:hypothetical protein
VFSPSRDDTSPSRTWKGGTQVGSVRTPRPRSQKRLVSGPGCRKLGGWSETSPLPTGGWALGESGTRARAGRVPRPRPPTSKLSTLMGERGSRISASSFLWRPAPAPSPGMASGAPGIFPVGGGRLMPPRRGPHSGSSRSGPAASGPSAAPDPPAPGGAPPGPTARL